MSKFSASAFRFSALSSVLCAPSLVLAASNLDLTLGADVEYHDNAALVSEDEQSDVDRVVRGRLDFDDPDGRLRVNAGYLVERHDYMDNVEEDSTQIEGASSFTWLAFPRLLDFTLSHQISDQLADRRVADVTSNRERRSIITAGANGYGHLSKVDTLILSPRYTDVSLESNSESDSQHSAVDLAWQHALSPVSAVVLSGSREHVRFDESVNDYDASRALLSYNTRLSRLSYTLGAGINRIEREVGEDVDGFSAQISADYTELSYAWGGSVVRQLTDSAIGLSSIERSLTGFQATDGNVGEFDIVESTEAEIHGSRRFGESSAVNARIGYVRQDYQDTPRDENSYYVGLGYDYTITFTWSVGLSASYENSDFPDDVNNLEQKDKRLDAFINYQHSERLQARFGVGREQRDANVSASEYTDNYVALSVNFLLY